MSNALSHRLRALAGIFAVLCIAASGTAADSGDDGFVPQYNPVLQVQRAPGKIKIDGDLSDPGWQGAQPAKNFTEHEPGEEVKPPVRTEAFVTYDNDNLYLAAVCYTDPTKIRASMCEREQIFSDDNIGFFFDTYGDGSRAYCINVNPYGIQYDALWSANYGEDANFDLIIESEGKITDSGYQVELAIPFAGLRFPNKPVQEWRFEFYRHHPREVHYAMSWSTFDKNEACWPCRWGTVRGIENVTPGKGIELLPSFVAHQSSQVTNASFPADSFDNGDIYGDLSLGGKYAVSSNLVVEGAYNPDFSQIEADASQVDVNTTFALFYDEKRPFFQEGLHLFRTNFNAVYTRSINDPDFAAKVSGKFGSTSIAALSAHDEHSLIIVPFEDSSSYVPTGKSYTNMLAVRQSFGQASHLGALVTDRRFDGGGSGTLASLDGALRLTKSLTMRGQFMVTHTEELDDGKTAEHLDTTTFDDEGHTAAFDGESFWGTGGLVGMAFEPRNVYVYVRAYQRTPTYRADNGYQPQNADRRVIAEGSYTQRPKGTIFTTIGYSAGLCRIWNFDGTRKQEWAEIGIGTNYRYAQGHICAHYNVTRERFGGIDFRDVWSVATHVAAVPLAAVELGAEVAYGHQIVRYAFAMGKENAMNVYASIRPIDGLLVEPSLVYSRSRDVDTDEEYFDGYIGRVRVHYQFNRELSLRLVGEYNDFYGRWNVDPLITYRINPFSTFYLGATYDYDEFNKCGITEDRSMTCLSQRQFFMKIQYLFQT
ncbi:MAG: carbohydrate binding family 9 domain-containing protein [candidate division Zixibacteria bacterium]|nr:carbohydrate binding family 9 domain-containing protein [candidate division Zixibacteria bacterium]